MSKETRHQRKEIRNLLTVIGSGVLAAIVLAGVMLYLYNPSGRYFAKNVLLSPQVLSNLSYVEKSAKTGMTERYTFDKMLFSTYEKEKKQWVSEPVADGAYREFYAAVAEDVSLRPVSEAVRGLFQQEMPSLLKVFMRKGRDQPPVTFQEVQFAPDGDLYRVQLRQQAGADNEGWAYFYHQGIERYARAVFYR